MTASSNFGTRPVLRPVTTTAWEQETWQAGPDTTLPLVIDSPSAWRFDFGRELPGWLEVDLADVGLADVGAGDVHPADVAPTPPPSLAGARWIWAAGAGARSSATLGTALDLAEATRLTLVVAVHGAATVWLDDTVVGRVLRTDAPLVTELAVPSGSGSARVRIDAAGDGEPAVAAVIMITAPDGSRTVRTDATWSAQCADRTGPAVELATVSADLPPCWPTDGISLGVSEFAEPMAVNPGPAHPVKIAAPHRHGDTYRLQLNADGFEGVRFGWLFVHTTPARPLRVGDVRLVSARELPAPLGRFRSSDAELDAIWQTAGHGVAVHVGRDYLTPILVDRGDRGQASGDSLPMTEGALAVFGALPVLRRNLDAVFGGDDYGTIESFGLYRVLTELTLFWWSGDPGPLAARSDRLVAELVRVDEAFDDPAVGWFGWDERIGGGFNKPRTPETVTALRALFVRTARAAAEAFAHLGQDALAQHWRTRADRRAGQLAAALPEHVGIHAWAELTVAGVSQPPATASRVSRVSYSPFNQLTILEALAAKGDHARALTTLKDHWGGQVRYGATTFFEVFRPEWATALPTNGAVPGSDCGWSSLAHGWGSGVAAWMARELLGVRPLTPGFAATAIAPHPGGLEHLSGAVPTPHGVVEVDLDDTRLEVVVPDGIARAEITVPGAETTTRGPGRHTLTRTLPSTGSAEAAPAEPWRYPATSRLDDPTTGGDGISLHGADGYVLFDHAGLGRDVSALPDYIASVAVDDDPAAWGTAVHRFVTEATTDVRALPDPRTGARRLGGRATRPPREMGLTFPLDVRVRPGAPHFQLALYLVDWERVGRRAFLEPYELATRELIAAPVAVDTCTEGRWIGFDCSGDTRVRVKQIGWPDIVVAAVGFTRLS